jgi:hypothetical protein
MEGTCAAWLAEIVLTDVNPNLKCRDLVGILCPDNGWMVDYEMANHIQSYVDMLRQRGGEITAEQRVVLNKDIAGTPDAFAIMHVENGAYHLIVDDLKYGYSIVEPTSKQVLIYAAAKVREMISNGLVVGQITLGIYQPRSRHHLGKYRTRTLTLSQLEAEINIVEHRGRVCLTDDPVTIPGQHCKYCPANTLCESVTTELYEVYTMVSEKANRMNTTAEIASELDFLERAKTMLDGRHNALKAEAIAIMDKGEIVPGWTRIRQKGNRRWTVDANTIYAMTGFDPRDGKMVTPAALERIGADAEIVNEFTEQPDTTPKLVRQTAEDFKRAFSHD